MTSPEPTTVNGLAPVMSTLVDRLYSRLPRIYRILDQQNGWAFKLWLGAALSFGGEIDDMIELVRGSRPLGPAVPEPWDLDPEDLDRWREAREVRMSLLADPESAPTEWLPWLAQLVGAYLPAGASLAERRDIIGGAGYRAGTRGAIADAARSALTDSRYVTVIPHQAGYAVGTIWDLTIRTRSTETPDPAEVLATIVRKGAKPAGARLWHTTFGTSWDRIEALFPTWEDWDAATWTKIEEAGVTYADVPENMAPGASFETAADIAKWTRQTEGGGSLPDWTLAEGAGIDGVAAGRLTKVGATGGMQVQSITIIDARILPEREYLYGISVRPSVTLNAALTIDWKNSTGAAISTSTITTTGLVAGQWTRLGNTVRRDSPLNAARAVLRVVATATVPAGATVDIDAALFRLVSTIGG